MKKILSVLLSIVMLISIISAIPATAIEVTSNVGYSQTVAESGRDKVPNTALDLSDDSVVVSSFNEDHGTKTAFKVSNWAGFVKLQEIVEAGNRLAGVTIYQTANIIPSEKTDFKGIGFKKSFSGIYDGQGYVIGNLNFLDNGSHNAGLFPYITTSIDAETPATVVIRNVVLQNCSVTSAKNKVGLLVGGTVDSPTLGKLIIANCKIDSTCTATFNGDITGGVIGALTQDASISNCTNNATMSFVKRCGGIVGRVAYTKGVVTITDCVFGGAMTSNQTTDAGASPIVGQASNPAIIVGCKTTGTIGIAEGKEGYIGAVIGQINKVDASNTVMFNNVDQSNTGLELVGNYYVTATTITAPSAMKLIGVQTGTGEADKMNLRFVAAVNDLETYASLRYKASVTGDKMAEYASVDTTKVYDSILANYGLDTITTTSAEVVNNNVQDATCKGLSALVVKGIPTSGVYRINITVYGVDGEGAEVWGHTATVTVENGVLTLINGEAVQTQQ